MSDFEALFDLPPHLYLRSYLVKKINLNLLIPYLQETKGKKYVNIPINHLKIGANFFLWDTFYFPSGT